VGAGVDGHPRERMKTHLIFCAYVAACFGVLALGVWLVRK
jgi:hypothetical protein